MKETADSSKDQSRMVDQNEQDKAKAKSKDKEKEKDKDKDSSPETTAMSYALDQMDVFADPYAEQYTANSTLPLSRNNQSTVSSSSFSSSSSSTTATTATTATTPVQFNFDRKDARKMRVLIMDQHGAQATRGMLVPSVVSCFHSVFVPLTPIPVVSFMHETPHLNAIT